MSLLPNFRESLGNMFKKPATLAYPLEPRPVPERTRGHVAIDLPACIFCGMCQRKCPTDAITVKRPEAYWAISRMRCIQCGSCVEVCPKKCLMLAAAQTKPDTTLTVDEFRGQIPEQPKKADA